MTVLIANSFTKSLDKLTADEQRQAKIAYFHLEPTEGSDISRFRLGADYPGESFFAHQFCFRRAQVPYKQIRSTLKAISARTLGRAGSARSRTLSRAQVRPGSR